MTGSTIVSHRATSPLSEKEKKKKGEEEEEKRKTYNSRKIYAYLRTHTFASSSVTTQLDLTGKKPSKENTLHQILSLSLWEKNGLSGVGICNFSSLSSYLTTKKKGGEGRRSVFLLLKTSNQSISNQSLSLWGGKAKGVCYTYLF